MKRLIEKIVFSGFITACRLATVPTRRSPESVKATTDGVVRPPSAFSMISGSPPSMAAMAELVVPRSIPIVFATFIPPKLRLRNLSGSLVDVCVFDKPGQKRGRGTGPRPPDESDVGRLYLIFNTL